MITEGPELLAAATPDGKAELIARLRDAVPEAFADGRLDLDRLRELAGDAIDTGPERYGLTWPGRREAIAMLQAPSRATLVPDRTESVAFDTARHVFIEGENLETLKLLYRAYFGRVKLIYIDPPYNTGNDFIYPDDFTDPLGAYLRATGQATEDGDLLTSRPETAGRKHSAWLSMMYPRLALARQLLKDEGVILISINDAEVSNLRRLCDEVFGEENFIAQIVWEKGRKNDAKLFSIGHEYILVYARSVAALNEARTIWREEKPGAREIWDEYLRLRAQHGSADKLIESDLQKWFSELPKADPSKKWSRYRRVDRNGPWRDDNISWPGSGGPRYDVIHPETRQPCIVPEAGWRFADPQVMQQQIDAGIVVFREDHTQPPFRKTHLRPVSAELMDDDQEPEDLDDGSEDELASMVRGTYLYKQAQPSVRHLRDLMGTKVFDNPKDHEELTRLFRYVVNGEPEPIVMDFFAGSAASAEAVLHMTASVPGARFVAVQLRQAVNAKERTGKAALASGWTDIAMLARERIRRVLARDAFAGREGFRAFRLAPSNLRRWSGTPERTADAYQAQLDAFADTLEPGWTAEDILWEVALREGLGLTATVEQLPHGKATYRVSDVERARAFTLSLDEDVPTDLARALGLKKDDLLICRATALDDTLAANLALQCHLKVL